MKISVTLANVYRSLGLLKEAQTLANAAKTQAKNNKSPEIRMQLMHLLERVAISQAMMLLQNCSGWH